MVLMQEEADSDFVHREGFGKGQGFANEAAQALAQRVVETLDVVGEPPLGVTRAMLLGGQDLVVALQVIGMKSAVAVGERDTPPEEPSGGVIARTQRVGHDLASAPAQGQPQPNHAPAAMAHEAPQLVQFQRVLGLGGCQGRL